MITTLSTAHNHNTQHSSIFWPY